MMQPIRSLLVFSAITFFLLTIANAQPAIKTYDKEWQSVEELIKRGLPQSALKEVNTIYAQAKKDKQDAQIIKALLYRSSLQQETREENEIASIKETEEEITQLNEPAASVLRSLLAGMYWHYFQQNRWKLYNRTATASFIKTDITTWATEDFHKRISSLYLASLANETLLKQTKLDPYDAIIIKGNVRHLRPTLFDLLAHTALDYFTNDESDITRPAYAFEISDSMFFAPAATFIKYPVKTNDSLSLHAKALEIYQQLVAFHLSDPSPDALLDADIGRLEFVHQYAANQNKDELYRRALQQLTVQYTDNPAAAQAWYLLAQQYNSLASTYQPYGDTSWRFGRVQAKEICEKIVAQKDSSEGKINCANLLNEITRKELHFQLEKVNLPVEPFRVLISYRNTKNIYLRVIHADENIKQQLDNYYNNKYWETITNTLPIASWGQSLPETNDYQLHSTEIKADGLPAGEYLLIASSDSDFNTRHAILGARLFYVSNISYVNNGNSYFVLHRSTGKPLTNAAVTLWRQVYDAQSRKYVQQKSGNYSTNQKGFFRIEHQKDEKNSYYNYTVEISWNREHLFLNDPVYSYYFDNEEKEIDTDAIKIFYFTDRSIYRPGQTVYFKGIAVSKDRSQLNKIVRNLSAWVYLEDVNGDDVDSVKVKTNEFGSFSGKFQLPVNLLNGEFSIWDSESDDEAHFSVEEYKRPRFYVDYEAPKNVFKINDSIHVTGFAKAYAGNNIDKAKVTYRVVRQPRYLYPWLFRRWWQPPVTAMEIVHGETVTDTNGKFIIDFKAIPDAAVDKKFEPLFDYRIYADVTDINGETRSGETSITAGFQSLLLKVQLPESLPADSFKTISIRTENMNGTWQPAVASVSITKLKEENRLIRQRYWPRPDQFVMTKAEYIKWFPHDEYDGESDFTNWENERTVFEKTDSLQEKQSFVIRNNGQTFSPGYYRIEITSHDKDGNAIKDIQYLELYDEGAKQLSRPQYLWTKSSQPIEPGEKTFVQLGTAASDCYVIEQTDYSNKQDTSFTFQSLDKEKKSFAFSATENDRGGYGVRYFFVKDNRFYQFSDIIKVPWNNKQLSIEYATFRDKTLPGSQETWKVKLSGYKSEKVTAEMLASMYDASLDQFKAHNWLLPNIWPTYNNDNSWNGVQNFSSVTSNEKWLPTTQGRSLLKEYDAFIGEESPIIYELKRTFALQRKPEEAAVSDSAMIAVPGNNLNEVVVTAYDVQKKKNLTGAVSKVNNNEPIENESSGYPIQVRKNFNETAFFFPDLRTDSTGAISFSFTLPEATTKWKFQALAHTPELAMGYSSREIVTQKQLMVQPNVPRFLREGDRLELSAKIVNLTDSELTGQAELQLFDAATNQPVDGWFQNMFAHQYFTVAAGQSEPVQFSIEVPYLFNKALTWRIIARSGQYSDGEEASLPVLTNKLLVTETMPVSMTGSGNKEFKFEKLLQAGESESLQHYGLTVEYTSNPAWYALQALPYLMEYPYECAEQTFNRYYANALATAITSTSPRIKEVFEKWLKSTNEKEEVLISALQKNEELKSVLLQETPWVLEAKNEEQQKKNIALLFDMVRMSRELNSNLEKLKQLQLSNGGFSWFSGGPDDRYITQYIVTGIGRLQKIQAIPKDQQDKIDAMLKKALAYLDARLKEDYDNLLKQKGKIGQLPPGYLQVQYLYMRSFFTGISIAKTVQPAVNFFFKQAQRYWPGQNKYLQGMIALAAYRKGDKHTAAAILKSLKETAITSQETGMYWKTASSSWWWYEAPIERQALLIEAFSEAGNDRTTADKLRTWLLKNKQTNNWQTTKATADACYALLLQGSNWLAAEPAVEIQLGRAVVSNTTASSEAGTGYFKKVIQGQFVSPDMGNIRVTVKQDNQTAAIPSWGAVYWQYFEDMDKITSAATPLQLSKKLFIEKNTDNGPVLIPVNEGDALHVGDKVKVRIELRADRDMEYVHMKDMRASGLEPVNVLSGYKWQNGLGYYETTKDASTNFFFDHLHKGTYVFEYTLFAAQKGNFSNGITSIQCMYAPEFAAHSEGIRIDVE